MLQEVLLFGFDTWVMSPRIGRRMGEFNHLVIHRLMVWQPIFLVYGIWVYPPLEVAMEEADLEELEMHVTHRHNTVTHFTATIPIVDLCLAAERSPGARVS